MRPCPNAPSPDGNDLDMLEIRAMMQNQYTNIGGVESLWTTHTVRRRRHERLRRPPRWYQVDVTGGTVAASTAQAATWDPDGANVITASCPAWRSTAPATWRSATARPSATTNPAIKYAGRLAADPPNTFSQTEQRPDPGHRLADRQLRRRACARWGDYSAMTLDPDGCTFWYTNEYYAANGLNHQTRIGSFHFPGCTDLPHPSPSHPTRARRPTSRALPANPVDARRGNPVRPSSSTAT